MRLVKRLGCRTTVQLVISVELLVLVIVRSQVIPLVEYTVDSIVDGVVKMLSLIGWIGLIGSCNDYQELAGIGSVGRIVGLGIVDCCGDDGGIRGIAGVGSVGMIVGLGMVDCRSDDEEVRGIAVPYQDFGCSCYSADVVLSCYLDGEAVDDSDDAAPIAANFCC